MQEPIAPLPAQAGEPPPDLDDDCQLHDSKLVRWLLICAGFISFAVGIIGLVVPVMPTAPFLLIAAACFARGSRTCYRWLVSSPRFGPPILEWRRHGSIAWRTKLIAMALFGLSLSASIVFFVRPWWLQLLVALIGLLVLAYLYRIPSRDRPGAQ